MGNSTDSKINQPINILEVVDNWYPIIDGVVKVVDYYSLHLNQKQDCGCSVVAPRYPKQPIIDNYKVLSCMSISGGKYGVRLPLPMFDLRLKKALKQGHYDIIHCHSPVTLGWYFARYAKKHNIPVVFTVHTQYHKEIYAHVKLGILRKIAVGFILSVIRKMDYYWAVSEGAKKMLIEEYGIKRECTVMSNGAELNPTENRNAEALEIKEKYGIKEGEKVFLSVGRLTEVKNFSMAIKAFAIMRNKGLHVKYLMVGTGDKEEDLKKEAAELELGDSIIFTGIINEKKILTELYEAADVLIMPSSFDTSSLAVKDAYAFNVPALAVRGSAAAEGIIDKENGFLADETVEAFAEQGEYIVNNPDVLKKVQQSCHDTLYHTWEEITDTVLEKYRQIVKEYQSKR